MRFKICTKCKVLKTTNQFHKRASAKDGLQLQCKRCNISGRVDYYKRNSQREKDYDKRRRLENRRKIWEYLSTHPCVDCGEADPVVLEFDHIRDKSRTISNFSKTGVAWATVVHEIEKCEVRCANCHRRKTAKQFNWYADLTQLVE